MQITRIFLFIFIIFLLIGDIQTAFSSNHYDKDNDETNDLDNLPESFDWRNIDGVDYTTSVKNQHPCSSCEAFAMASIIETLVQYEVGYPFDCDLSEAHLFFMNDGNCKYGANFTKMFNFLMEYGIADEDSFPYVNRDHETPISEAVDGWQNRTVKISNWSWIDNSETSIKKALIEHGPIFALIKISLDFISYRSGIFSPSKKFIDVHALSIFGYNDTGRYWIIKNSWGETWGEKGWLKLSYDADMFITGEGTVYENITGGGTGLSYMDGVYGNFKPDVPKVNIIHPERSYSYVKDVYWMSLISRNLFRSESRIWFLILLIEKELFGDLIFDTRTPKIFRGTNIIVKTTGDNITKVEIFIDNVLKHTSPEPSFEWYWDVNVEKGTHEIKAVAYNSIGAISKDIIDVYTFK